MKQEETAQKKPLLSRTKTVRMLTFIVFYCISFTSIMYTSGFIVAVCWEDADLLDRVMYYCTWMYGGELCFTCIIRLLGDKFTPEGKVGKTLSD